MKKICQIATTKKNGQSNTTTYFPDELNSMIGKQFLFRVLYSKYNHTNNSHVYRCEKVSDDEEMVSYWKKGFFTAVEDAQDKYTTPATSTKYSKLLDLSLPRRFQLQSPPSGGDGSTSGQSLVSVKKRERNIVIMDLSDSEYDTDKEAKEPNAKKPLVGDDEDQSATKELVKVKVEHE
ncbi:hypothetical protein Tco_0019136 [Tanacetum coccineum]